VAAAGDAFGGEAVSAEGTATQRELRDGFRAFVIASQRLEESHAALQRRAAAIDLELAATNRALEAALGEKEAILRCLPVGVLAASAAGEVIWSNPEGERLQQGAARSGLRLAELPEGECERGPLCLAVRRAPLPGGGTLVVAEDRSRLQRLTREVDRLDRLAGLSELALGVAHEIKNPLNGVMGFAALLERSDDPGELRRYARKVHEGLLQVDGIVREMLELARAPSRGDDVETLAAVVRRAASAAGVPSAWIEVTSGGELMVAGGALARVLANLFRNSAEAGAMPVAIRVAAAAAADRVEVLVTDDGPGVDARLGHTVFEPFVSSKPRGHGLGLALASRVMAFLGGSLELTNPGEPGASFRLTLPRPQRTPSP
jgi:signal transduction histidine kinase